MAFRTDGFPLWVAPVASSAESIKLLGTGIGRGGLYDRVVRERDKAEEFDLSQIIKAACSSDKDERLLRETLSTRSTSWAVMIENRTGSTSHLHFLESSGGNFANRRSSFSF